MSIIMLKNILRQFLKRAKYVMEQLTYILHLNIELMKCLQ